MNKAENIAENVEVGVSPVTIEIPVCVTMTSVDQPAFEFTMSIDEFGQIVLTPTTKETEFIDAIIVSADEDKTSQSQELQTFEGNLVRKKICIDITANMLAESDNLSVSAVVDEIGQVVIHPIAKENVFVTASFEQSLNLVTEEKGCVDYFGYKLVSTPEGWNIYDYTNELISKDAPTLTAAKLVACTTEIKLLEREIDCVTHDIEESVEENNSLSETQPIQEIEHDITAELVEQSSMNTITDEEKKLNLITRFMQGEIPIFSDTGEPLDSYMHIPELDSKGYAYYYDENSDAVVSYPMNMRRE